MIISISNNAELTHTSTTEEDLDQALVTLTEEQTTAIMDAMIKSKTFQENYLRMKRQFGKGAWVLRAYNKQELLQQDPEACFFVHEKAFKKCFVINDEVTTTFDEDYSSDADQALLYLCFRYSYTKGNSVFTGERYHCKLINIIVTQDQQEQNDTYDK